MAADESLSIEITDRVAPTINNKILAIAQNARDGATAVDKLKNALASLSVGSSVSKLQSELAKLNSAITQNVGSAGKLATAAQRAALSQAKLTTEMQRTQTAMAQTEAALQKAIAAENQAKTAAANLAAAQMNASTQAQKFVTAQQQTATAATQAATALVNLTTAQNNQLASVQRLNAAQSQAAAAQSRAQTAATQASTAQQTLAAATVRVTTAQTQGATAAAKLATEQQRTAAQAANAAAAADRAALAALRLAQAQNQAGNAAARSTSSLAGWVRAAAGVLGVGISAHAILAMADAYTVLQNKLQNVTSSQGEVVELTQRLFEVANRTRSPVMETATAFTRFDRALKILGKSQEDTLRMTETVNKALIVSGATAAETGSVLLQLSQAFNAGKLQGDEFRSVAENMPMILDAVAKVLEKPIDQVKKLGTEGKITADIMYKAFKLIETSVDETFGKTTPTISQAFTVLNNSATETFGRFDKALGITAGLSAAIIALSKNMDVLAVSAAVVGAALLVYFGPTLVNAITVATRAMWAFTVAVASNPIGALIVAVTAATVAIAVFGDEVQLVAGKATTLKDYFRSAWSFIQDGAKVAAEEVKTQWNAAIDFLNEKTGGWGEQFRDVGSAIGRLTKTYVNTMIALWVSGFKIVQLTWRQLPVILNGFFIDTVNFCSTAVSQILNLWQEGIKLIGRMIEPLAPNMVASLNSALDAIKIELPKMDTNKAAEGIANDIKTAVTTAFNTDFVGDAMGAIERRADGIAQTRQRNKRQGVGEVNLRGAGASQLSGAGDGKAAESRAKAMQKVNAELDNEINRLFQLKPLREAQAKFDDIELQLKQKKITLSAAEAQSIKDRIKLIQDSNFVQAEFDRIYEESIEPVRTHNSVLQAAAKLLEQGAISQRKANDAVAAANDVYENAINPIRQYTKELNDQMNLANMLPKQREVEQQMIQINNDLLSKKIVLTAEESTALREQITLLQQRNSISQQEAALYDASVGKRQQYIDQLNAINNLLNNPTSGFTGGDAAGAAVTLIQQMGLDPTGLQVNAEMNVSTLQTMYDQIAQLRAKDIIGEQDAAALRAQAWSMQQANQLKTASTFFGSLEGLQKSSNKKLAAVGKAAAIANALVNTYTAATGAYAAMAPIPFVGPFLGAAAAAAAVVAGMANVSAIRSQNPGFKEGGFTGNFGVNEVVGNVHGREFVMDAASTANIGVADLEALRRGAASVQRNGDQAGKAAAPASEYGSKGPNSRATKTTEVNNTFVLPNITSEREARESTAAISRSVNATVQNSSRYN